MKAFSTSVSKTAAFSSEKIFYIACTTASTPAPYPVLSCKAPVGYVMSFLNNIITALPAILCSTSHIPISLSPGFLSSGISQQATDDSNDYGDSSSSTQNVLISWENVLRKFNVAVPKTREVTTLFQPSASRPDGPDPLLLTFKLSLLMTHPCHRTLQDE